MEARDGSVLGKGFRMEFVLNWGQVLNGMGFWTEEHFWTGKSFGVKDCFVLDTGLECSTETRKCFGLEDDWRQVGGWCLH